MTDLQGLEKIQDEIGEWVKKNFSNNRDYHPLLGIGEELGELMHVRLKSEQGIRGYDDGEKVISEETDAIGDLLIYLLSYCNERGYSAAAILDVTWGTVKRRDWLTRPTDAHDLTR